MKAKSRTPTKVRTPNDECGPDDMEAALEGFAKDKSFALDWELEQYEKRRRGQGPDREGLEHYYDLLMVVISLCPYGQPALAMLRLVWLSLNKRFKIRNPAHAAKVGASEDGWAHGCADRLRVACQHLKDLCTSPGGSEYCSKKVRGLISKVKLYNGKPLKKTDTSCTEETAVSPSKKKDS